MYIKEIIAFTLLIVSICNAAEYKVVAVEKDANDLGEGPHWDEKSQKLFHVDINNNEVCRLDVVTEARECFKLADIITVVIPFDTGDDIMVTERNKVVKLNWKTKAHEVLGEVAPELKGKERFNDAKIDAKGRLWIGTFLNGPSGDVLAGKGNLYKFIDGKFIKQAEGFTLTNGLIWSKDNKKLFVNDSEGRKIYVFDFDLETGTASNKKVLVNCVNNTDFKDGEYPDGLTADHNGVLWAALYGGKKVVKINPDTGRVLDHVDVPCPLTTSLCFGGANYDQLFVTTAYKNYGPDLRTQGYPNCGLVHRITSSDPDFKGPGPMKRYKPEVK